MTSKTARIAGDVLTIANGFIELGALAADLVALYKAGSITKEQMRAQLESAREEYEDDAQDTREAIARRRQQLSAQVSS